MKVTRATPAELPAISQLLTDAGLPLDGFSEHIGHAVVARDNGTIVGSAALELYGTDALLRSVAVADRHRGSGLGQALVASALAHAREEQVQRVFLLTETAEAFFPRFGFTTIPRADVPVSVQQSVEFTSACPASATVMVTTIGLSGE